MPIGTCELCKNKGELRDSHYLSKFAYKRYVSNQARGGRFADLKSQKHHNKQLTDYLLCDECEERFCASESSAAQFLSRVEGNPTSDHEYDNSMHYFAVSISWRIAVHSLRSGFPKEMPVLLRPASRYWSRHLLAKRKDVGPYSQHAFIAFGENIPGKDAEWHRMIGGQIFFEERLVLSRIGPLLIAGLLDRAHLILSEIRTWERSRLHPTAGIITPISKHRYEDSLTPGFARLLNQLESRLANLGARMAQ
jgi:hypothetical protein